MLEAAAVAVAVAVAAAVLLASKPVHSIKDYFLGCGLGGPESGSKTLAHGARSGSGGNGLFICFCCDQYFMRRATVWRFRGSSASSHHGCEGCGKSEQELRKMWYVPERECSTGEVMYRSSSLRKMWYEM